MKETTPYADSAGSDTQGAGYEKATARMNALRMMMPNSQVETVARSRRGA